MICFRKMIWGGIAIFTLVGQAEAAFLPHKKEYKLLDHLANTTYQDFSSDKGSLKHNYTDIYARYFHPIKNKKLKFMEIGIYQGASVHLWEDYFKNAECHFVDINFDHVKYFSERSKYHLADQANVQDLNKIILHTGGNFDIIIDDGGHTMNQQIVSFCTLFPHVKQGGMYIIEDVHTSYWSNYGGNGSPSNPASGPATTVEFLKSLVDDLNFVGARTESANHLNIPIEVDKELNYYQKNIYSIHFYDSLCIIIKR